MTVPDGAPRRETIVAAVGLAIVTAIGVAAMPAGLIEALVSVSGIEALIPAAAPPLGLTARIILALLAGVTIGGFFVGLMALLEHDHRLRRRRARAARSADSDAPPLRRGDAHPDAPARRPLSALSELVLETPEPAPAVDGLSALLARLDRGLAARGGRKPIATPAMIDGIDAALKDMMGALQRTARG